MESSLTPMKVFFWRLIWISILVLAGCAYEGGQETPTIRLTGAQEVPPVTTAASGNGQISVLSDRSVSGSVTISGVAAKAAHIHEGAPGKVGPVIIPLTKTSDDTWSVPAGAKLTESQYMAYLAGNLYVNVHSAAQPGGEIRGQMPPPAPPPRAMPQPMSHYGY